MDKVSLLALTRVKQDLEILGKDGTAQTPYYSNK